ncbi:MAG: RraA family protein, partial [Bacillota bacterium]|nr:RraA family protein [Bacillota bacterium]
AEVVDGAAKSHIKDIFGFEMITQNVFTTAEIDRNIWTVGMLDMLTRFIAEDSRGEHYRELDWSPEYEAARKDTSDATQSAL